MTSLSNNTIFGIIIAVHMLSLILMAGVILNFRHIYHAREAIHKTKAVGHAHTEQRTYGMVWMYASMTVTIAFLTSIFFLQLS